MNTTPSHVVIVVIIEVKDYGQFLFQAPKIAHKHIRNAVKLIVTFKPITMKHAAIYISIMLAFGAYHLRNLLVVSVNEFVCNLIFSLFYVLLQTMFYALTRKTSAKVASCQPRVYADLSKDGSRIRQEVEKEGSTNVKGLGITSKTLMWLRDDHNQTGYEDYTSNGISVVQSILDVSGTLDAHSDVRKFGGDCSNTVTTSSWGIHPNVKLLLLFFSFVVQYVCIHL